MTVFNPDNKDMLTYGETLGPAMKVVDQEDADQYFEQYVQYMMSRGNYSREEAIKICKINLSYFAGYHSPETWKRVAKLYNI